MKRAMTAGAAVLLLGLPVWARPDDLSLPGVTPAAPKKEEAKKPAALAPDDLSLDTAPTKKPEAKKPAAPADDLALDTAPAKKASAKKGADLKVDDLSLTPAPAAEAKKADKKDAKDSKKDAVVADAAKADKPVDAKDAKKDAAAAAPAATAAKDTKRDKPAAAATPATATTTATGSASSAGAAGATTGGAQSSTAATRTLQADKVSAMPGQNLGAPEQRQGLGSPVVAAPGEKPLWSVSLFAGAERATERYVADATSLTRLGLSGSRWFAGQWQVLASLDFRTSKQAYVIGRPSADGSPRPPALLDEQRWEGDLGIGYDTGPRIVESGRMLLMPTLSFKYLTLQNDAFPANLLGLEIGGRFAWELSSAVTVHAEGGYTFNFTESDTQSALGAPKGLGRWVAGLRLPLNGGFALELNYVGNVLAFSNAFRFANGAALGFDVNF